MFFIMSGNSSDEILVSVIIPVYNGEKFIASTIESVFCQNHTDTELIVVDDGSSDRTVEIITRFLNEGKNIQIIHLNRSGVSRARNEGMKMAKGKYISFLDADDVWLSQNLSIKVDFLEKHLKAFGVTSSYEEINESGVYSGIIKSGDLEITLRDLLVWKGNYITIPSGIVFRADHIQQFGGFNEELSNNADQELVMRLLSKKLSFFTLPEKSWLYRRHGNNMSARLDLMESDTLRCYKMAEKRGYFNSLLFKHKCFSRMAMIMALSWLKGKNFSRGLKWLGTSFFYSPVYFTGDIINRMIDWLKEWHSAKKK